MPKYSKRRLSKRHNKKRHMSKRHNKKRGTRRVRKTIYGGMDLDILYKDKGDNYVICNEESVQMINVVLDIYKASNIDVCVNSDMSIVEIDTNNVVATTLLNRVGDIISDIKGSSKKLKELGWKPQFTIQDIINDIVNKF